MRRFLPASLLLIWTTSLTAQAPYQIGPPPPWVRVHKPDLTARPVRSEGWEYVLTDRQESVGPAGSAGIERYWHVAYRLLDGAAVNDNSQVEVVFDSTYQRLTLHSVTVWRGGRGFDQLKKSRIHVAQRETDLAYRIFDGSLTVVVLLEDVRPGDIIEYSYTRVGSNPVFRGHYMTDFQFQSTAPIGEQYVRLLWRRDRPLRLHALGMTPQPTVTAVGASHQYEWSQRNVPPVTVETDVPDWFDPYGTLQVSDFASWRDVAAWGDSLFTGATLPAPLQEVVKRIRASSDSEERRALQALRWVQDEIRYTGVEIGTNSHQPYSPAVVNKRRYGDCKDKALLLITMLRALGMTARPALVSTTYGGHVGDYVPTASLFDHAIVQVVVNGRDYWIDPTDVDQRGGIGDVATYYGAALVLGGSTDSLVTMPNLRRPGPTTDIVVSFDVGDMNEPTTMNVETLYSGRTASGMRASTKGSSREELQRNYVEYYAKLYPSIRSEQIPLIQDDEAANVLRVVERYTIPDFWTGDSTEGRRGEFEPLELSNSIPAATQTSRSMPLAVSHPVHIRYVINARFKAGWSVRNRTEHVATPAARFSYSSSVENKVLTLSYEYETLADHVLPAAATAHIKDMARARDMLVFRVTPPSHASDSAGRMNWSVLLTALFALAIAAMAAVRVSRAQLALATGSPAPVGVPSSEPVGLGGWLILVGIGVTLSPLRILFTMSKTLSSYSVSTWARLTTPGEPSYHALWAPVLLFELIANVALFVFFCFLIYLFYKRKKQFPVVFIWVASASIVMTLLDALFAQLLPVSDPAAIRWQGVVPTLIWILYMQRSRRVRNTFIN